MIMPINVMDFNYTDTASFPQPVTIIAILLMPVYIVVSLQVPTVIHIIKWVLITEKKQKLLYICDELLLCCLCYYLQNYL